MSEPIDDQLRRYYQSIELSEESLQRLRSLEKAQPARRFGRVQQYLAVAAVMALAIVGGVAIVQYSAEIAEPNESIADSGSEISVIAADLAMRHENCQGHEFFGEDLAGVVRQMTDLGFDPVMPDNEQFAGLQLEGAHYCMVDGRRALHVIFSDPSGERVSLFEVVAPPHLATMTTAVARVDGYLVEIERHEGLLVAIAQPAA